MIIVTVSVYSKMVVVTVYSEMTIMFVGKRLREFMWDEDC